MLGESVTVYISTALLSSEEKCQIQKNILKNIPEHNIAPYLACGQPAEEGETGFPTRVKKDRSRFITRDQSFVMDASLCYAAFQNTLKKRVRNNLTD